MVLQLFLKRVMLVQWPSQFLFSAKFQSETRYVRTKIWLARLSSRKDNEKWMKRLCWISFSATNHLSPLHPPPLRNIYETFATAHWAQWEKTLWQHFCQDIINGNFYEKYKIRYIVRRSNRENSLGLVFSYWKFYWILESASKYHELLKNCVKQIKLLCKNKTGSSHTLNWAVHNAEHNFGKPIFVGTISAWIHKL